MTTNTMPREERLVIINTALKQLTGRNNPVNTLMAMGAYGFCDGETDGNPVCTFRMRGISLKANAARLTYNRAMDLYELKLFKIRGMNFKEVYSEEGLYADMLRSEFESNSGFNVSL